MNKFHLKNPPNIPLPRLKPPPPPPCPLLSTNLRLKSLAHSDLLSDARHLFDQMPHRDDYSWNTLITAYVRSNRLREALDLFAHSPTRLSSTISWSFLVSALARRSRRHEALGLFRQMLVEGPTPDRYALGAALRAADFSVGRQIHALAVKTLLAGNSFVVAGLVDLYAKSRRIGDASRLFASVPQDDRKNHVLWAAMVTGHVQNGDAVAAIHFFKLMRSDGVSPNQFVLPSVLAACGAENLVGIGRQVHGFVVRSGFESNDFVQCSLVDMYAKCGNLVTARLVLDDMGIYDVVAWNSLLVGYARSGLEREALSLFAEMRHRGLELDGFTYPVILTCVGSIGLVEEFGRSIHCLLVKSGFELRHQHTSNALLDMYARSGKLDCACDIFDWIEEKDVVTWTTLIVSLTRHNCHEKALQLYREMKEEGRVNSDEFLVAAVLSSCAGLAVLEMGIQLHALAIRFSFDSFVTVANSAITMYAKCGCVDESRQIFDLVVVKDIFTWTAMIVAYAQNGRGRDSLWVYNWMIESGARPDYVTFIGLLFACSHAGLVEEGKIHFEAMEKVHGVAPGPEHYASMVDLLGRSGRVQEATGLLNQMVTPPDFNTWMTLLSACRVHRNVPLAEFAAEKLFELDPANAGAYILLSNVYSTARQWNDMARVRRRMRSRGIIKEPGCSWMEVGRKVHIFRSEDAIHPSMEEVYLKVEEMMDRIEDEGYVTDMDWEMHENGKQRGLKYHSEKLAVAFGLTSTPKEAPIRVFKNLRVCGDCHNAMKFISKVYRRKIVLRDSNCFHHFSGGVCSCGDYW